MDYYQEYIVLWKAEQIAATAASDIARQAAATNGQNHFEGLMDTECKTKFTAKALVTADQTKQYQYDSGNTKIIIGDHTTYFDAIQTKDACKVKTCTWVKNADGLADAANSASFESVLETTKWTWKIQKLDVTAGKVFPAYKMKCEIDINLGGLSPTTTDKFGNSVTVT